MPEENDRCGKVNESWEIFGMVLIAHNQSAEVKKPGEHSFDFPSADISSERPPVLRRGFAPVSVRRDHLCSVILHELLVQPIAVIRFVADQTLGHFWDDALFERRRDEFHFSRRSV